ncbi:MAG: hypothetical protein ACD_79C00187G0002 [uncultured bacterium]|nr:MAG: hypothetical protein ACD_79C00187G0002 [uncultured bacterium]
MKFFSKFFKIFIFLIICDLSFAAATLPISSNYLNLAKNILISMNKIPKENRDLKNIKNMISKDVQFNGEITPVFSDNENIIVLWKHSSFKVMLVLSENDLDRGFKDNSFPPKTAIFSPGDFDFWLLLNKKIFDELAFNQQFLASWLLLENQVSENSLESLQSYIFNLDTPKDNYTLAAIIGEDKFFPDITEDDQELYFLNLPILHFNIATDEKYIFYCKVHDVAILKTLENYLEKFLADQNLKKIFQKAISLKINGIQNTKFVKANFLNDLKDVLNDISKKYDFSNIPLDNIEALTANITNFLLSNGITSFKDLKTCDEFLKNEIADRFYCAKTTAFFRDWREMKFLENWLADLEERCMNESRPIKIKVFGCSTGQEPLSYAFDLLNLGINNFKILSSDIDPKVISEARKMIYSENKFENLPNTIKDFILKNYFDSNDEKSFQIKYQNFFNERIFYTIQDITKPLSLENIDPEYKSPYDIVSVKNILLYLDKESTGKAVGLLKDIVAPYGIIVLKDKRYKASGFLSSVFNNFIGISDYIVMREPDFKSKKDMLKIFNLFKKNSPPQFFQYFYNYLKTNNYNDLKPELITLLESDHPENYHSQEALFDYYILNMNSVSSEKALKNICKTAPLRSMPYFLNFYDKFANDSLKNLIKKISQYYDETSTSTNEAELLKNTKNILKDFVYASIPDEFKVILAQTIAARDLSAFPQIQPSSDGTWLTMTLNFLDEALKLKYSDLVFDNKIQFFNHFTYLYVKEFDEKNKTYIKSILEDLQKINPENLSLSGRISLGKLCCLYGKTIFSNKERINLYNTALKFCTFNENELRLLSDKWYSDYYSIQFTSKADLAFNEDFKLEKAVLVTYLNEALDALEQSISARTVYGYSEVTLRKKITDKLKELQ